MPAPEPGRIRLFGFPHAGAGCAAFAELAVALCPAAELWSVNLPGRQARVFEPPITDLGTLVTILTDDLMARLDHRPYALAGYCGGALLAYLVTAAVERRGGRCPERLIAVSFRAPDRIDVGPALTRLPSEEFWAQVLSFGGVAPELVAEPNIREIFETAVRADYELLARYEHRMAKPLRTPVSVLYGDDDVTLTEDELRHWSGVCAAEPRLLPIPGGHWLLDDGVDALASGITEELARPTGGRPFEDGPRGCPTRQK